MHGELARRILSGCLLAIVVLAATWYGGAVFRLLVAVAALLIYYEWSTLSGARADAPRIDLFAWIVVLCCAVAVIVYGSQMALFLGLIGGVVACLWGLVVLGNAWIGVGILYASLSAVALAAVRGEGAAGLVAMLFIFAVVWATDIGAYFAGRHFGGPKLAPRISPSKTWSGAVGGAVAAVIAGTVVCFLAAIPSYFWVPFAALVLSIVSQTGDLFESWVKRRFGVKDSSRLIPGHGGVMDRIDGLVFAAFAAYLVIAAMPGSLAAQAGGGGASRHFLAVTPASSPSHGEASHGPAFTGTEPWAL